LYFCFFITILIQVLPFLALEDSKNKPPGRSTTTPHSTTPPSKITTTMRFLPTFLSLVAVSTAAPTNFFDDAYDFSEGLLDYYSKVSQHINRLRHSKTPVGCDASKITLPSYASGLKAPDGLSPMYVAIGRGTQVCRA
jgi:hypothetical protein